MNNKNLIVPLSAIALLLSTCGAVAAQPAATFDLSVWSYEFDKSTIDSDDQDISVGQDLGLEDGNAFSLGLNFSLPERMNRYWMPRFGLRYARLKTDTMRQANSDFIFLGIAVQSNNTTIRTVFETDVADALAYWSFGKRVNFRVGAGIKHFDGQLEVFATDNGGNSVDPTTSSREPKRDFSDTIPAAHLAVGFRPSRFVSVSLDTLASWDSDRQFSDVAARVFWAPKDWVALAAGFRLLNIDFKDMDGVDYDLKMSGPFLGVVVPLSVVGVGDTGFRPSDADGDGVLDANDECPNTRPGAAVDEKGCALPVDTDADGVTDDDDKCPGTPAGTRVDDHGCAYLHGDEDFDGVTNSKDQCPGTPRGATVDERGCPGDDDQDRVLNGIDECPETPAQTRVDRSGCALDDDRDGVNNLRDKCPGTLPELEVDADGCVLRAQTMTLVGVTFELDSATLTTGARSALNTVARALKRQPELEIEIAGHTDATGGAAHNQLLSARRAISVLEYLVSRGVDRARLVAVGYGQSRPLADNDSESGREKNRRVELRIRDS